MRAFSVTVACIGMLLVTSFACPMDAKGKMDSGVDPYLFPVPSHGAYTGAYCPDPDTHAITEKSIYDFVALTGKKILFVHLFVNWLEDDPMGESAFLPFPAQTCEMIRRMGSVPLITWQANLEPNESGKGYLLDRIAQGEFDEHLRSWAGKIKRHAGPIFLRWGHEMNGDWFPWSGAQNGGGKPMPGSASADASGPIRFQQAWNHIQDVFRMERVTNVQWVWSVYHSNLLDQAWNETEAYWPGPDRVDWLGICAVNLSRANSEGRGKWQNFGDIIDPCYERLVGLFPGKPILLAEWACANQVDKEDGDKATWIKEAFSALPRKYPQIKAICWYNDSMEVQPGYYPANLRLDFAPHSKAYAQGVSSSYYLETMPKIAPKIVPKPAPKVEPKKKEPPKLVKNRS